MRKQTCPRYYARRSQYHCRKMHSNREEASDKCKVRNIPPITSVCISKKSMSKKWYRAFLVVLRLHLPLQGPWVRSLVGEVTHVARCGQKKEKKVQMNLFTKQKQSHRCGKQTYGYQGGMGEG